MGLRDYISYIRRNGQELLKYEFELPYLSYINDDIDDNSVSIIGINLDINYNLLSNVIKDSTLENGSQIFETSGMVITHVYPKGTSKENIENLFFRTDLLTPTYFKIEPNVEYNSDEWMFNNGYGIIESIYSKTGIWKLGFDNLKDEHEIDHNKLTFIPDPLLDYYAVAVDTDSIKYILNHDQLDVPFCLLDEIITNHNITINDNLTKKQVIDLVRTYFSDVSKYLDTYLKTNVIN